MNIADKIKQLRKDYGWSQQQLADAIELSQAAISHIEADKVYPTIWTLEAIATATNTELVIEFQQKGEE